MKSIRSHLLILQTSALLVTALLVSLTTFRLAWHGFNNVRDLGLEQIAAAVLRHDPSLESPTLPAVPEVVDHDLPVDHEDRDHFVSQIWTRDGQLLFSSWAQVGPPPQPLGHHIVTWRGQSWRVYTVAKDERVVQVAVTTAIRRQHFYDLVRWLALPMVLLVLLLGFLLYQAIGWALKPLEDLRREVGERGDRRLHAIPTEGLPQEVLALTRTLNDLLHRLDVVLAAHKRFIADAAHELNTPLAAIRLQAQLLRRVPPNERDAALDELERGIARAGRMAQQLLELARFDPEVRLHQEEVVPLDALLADTVAAFEGRATAQGILLRGHVAPDATGLSIRGDPHALRTLLDNLLENALRYAGRGAHVEVALQRERNAALLRVADSGPGIPAHERERVLERFVRLDTRPRGGHYGSGLGLSIVQSIVAVHGGRLELGESRWGGLEVRVRLPLAPAPSP